MQKIFAFTSKMSNIFIEIRITKPVMLERSEASKKPRNCHHCCRGGVGPPKKRREITKQQDLSCWNEVKHLKNREIIITVVGAGSARPKNDAR